MHRRLSPSAVDVAATAPAVRLRPQLPLEQAVVASDILGQMLQGLNKLGVTGFGTLAGAVAFAVAAFEPRDCRHETSPPSPCSDATICLRRLPLPTRCDRAGGPLVAALRLSYREVEELLTERGVEVDHVTVYRWVQRFTPLLAGAARPCRHAVGDRWYIDET
jgi:hypothetical protein